MSTNDFSELDAMANEQPRSHWPILMAGLIGLVSGVSLHQPVVVQKLQQGETIVTCVLSGGNPLAPVSESSAPFGATIHGIQCSFFANDDFTYYIAEMEKRYPDTRMGIVSVIRN